MKLTIGEIIVQPLTSRYLADVKRIRDLSLPYLNSQQSYSLKETQEWFAKTTPKWYSILLGSTFIGYIRTSNYNTKNKSLYIGLDLDPDYIGNGYAYQVYMEFTQWLRREGYTKVFLQVQVSNFRAYSLYRKIGFTSIGILEDYIVLPNLTSSDVILMHKKL